MARIPPIAVSGELLAALTARAESERRTPSAMARVILEDALLPKPDPVLTPEENRRITFTAEPTPPNMPNPGVPEKRPPRRILRLGHEFKPYSNDNLHCSVPNCGRTLAKH